MREDLFPCRVFTTTDLTDPSAHRDLLFDRCRVLITMDAVLVFIDAPDGPALAMSARLDDLDPTSSRRAGFRLTLSNPTLTPTNSPNLIVVRDNHCGCGSRLRAFRPFLNATTLAAKRGYSAGMTPI